MVAAVRLSREWRARFANVDWALPTFAIVVVGLATLATKLLDYPGVHGDEPIYTDPGASLAAGTGLASPVLAGLQQGVDTHFYLQVPAYPVALAGWLRVFGFGLLQVRAFSVACGVVTAILVFFIVRRHAPVWCAVAAGLVIEVSGWVVFSSRIGRPEITAVCVVTAACLAHDVARSRRSMRFVAGLLAGLAVCVHPIGGIAVVAIGIDLVLEHGRAVVLDRGALLVAAGFGLVIGAWGLWILQAPADFWAQFGYDLKLQAAYTPVFSFGGLWTYTHSRLPALAVLVGAAVWLGRQSLRVPEERFWVLAAGVALVLSLLGRETIYVVYAIPPLAACLGIAAQRIDRAWLAGAAFALVLGNESAITAYHVIETPAGQEAKANAALLATVPPGKSVFIGPGGEFGYYALHGRNPLLLYVVGIPPGIAQTGVRETDLVATKDYLIQGPNPYLPAVGGAAFSQDLQPVAVINPGPGYYILVYRLK